MARKYIRKFTMAIIVLHIFMAIKIQANNVASASFAPSNSILELEKSQEPKMHACFTRAYGYCKTKSLRERSVRAFVMEELIFYVK
jgi:hypothetical protein